MRLRIAQMFIGKLATSSIVTDIKDLVETSINYRDVPIRGMSVPFQDRENWKQSVSFIFEGINAIEPGTEHS